MDATESAVYLQTVYMNTVKPSHTNVIYAVLIISEHIVNYIAPLYFV